jgi:fatty acid synthase
MLRGSNTGVYIGFTTIGTAEGIPQTDEEAANNAFLMMGTSRAIYANRINFVFDFRGPSNIMDTACASSMTAVYHAINDIKRGTCDQAIVAGVNLCLAPFSNYMMTAVGAVSVTGESRVFDDKANGYVRSEACVSVFLQRKNSAKRIYATILNCRTNADGFKRPGLFFPSSEMQSNLMAKVCNEIDIDPCLIDYFEAHGTGTRAGDPQEVIAINQTFSNGRRSTPLLIGSVKSIVGHSEGASGLVSISKVLIAFEKQMIPSNLNFNSPNELIKHLIPSKIQVVTENTPFFGKIVGVNSYGIGGVNVNMLLKSNEITEDFNKFEKDELPLLICLCARNSESLNFLFDFIESNQIKINKYFLSLLNNIIHYKPNIGSNGFPCRGYMIAKNCKERKVGQNENLEFIKIPKCDIERKPLVFLFPGFGCQWQAMGKCLMDLEIFSKKIDELAIILSELNIDLRHILTSDCEKSMKTCTSIFVAITAIQIALVEVLNSIEIKPDFIVGHSFGEIACAYADGSLSAREAILCSYWRGNCLEISSIIPGAMIAVEMTWEQAIDKCKGKGIIAACHNSEKSVTLSGPEEEILRMKNDLEKENLFVRQVRGVELPFHSHYLKSAEKLMLDKLDQVINSPKKRSEKWLSTSASNENSKIDGLNFASSKYFVNNLLSPVYFHEAMQRLPDNCVIIEIAPHSLFESVLKQNSGNSISYITLMKRNDNENNLIRLFSAVGELYLNGFSPKIEKLYPEVQFPVPRGTQSISSLIRWDHNKSYFVRKFPDYYNHVSASKYIYKIQLGSSSR